MCFPLISHALAYRDQKAPLLLDLAIQSSSSFTWFSRTLQRMLGDQVSSKVLSLYPFSPDGFSDFV